MESLENRRPLSARDWGIIQKSAKWLSRRDITPNQISVASAVFAALAGWSIAGLPAANGLWFWLLPIISVLLITGRALCNLFDGMVAVEGGKSTKSGELFNDIPDRFSDAFIMVGAGYACQNYVYGMDLGWCAALLSVCTAYIRILGRAAGAPSDFSGPMAKTHRMAVICLGILLTPVELLFGSFGLCLLIALIIINIGCIITCAKRAYTAYKFIEGK